MNQPTIACPHCRSDIKLNESLAGPLIEATKQEYEAKLFAANETVARREEALRAELGKLEQAKAAIGEEVGRRLASERAAIAAEEARKAKAAIGLDMEERDRKLSEMAATLQVRDAKLAEAQEQQARFLKKERELDDAQRELALTVERQVQQGLAAVREKAKAEAEDGLKLKVAEKEETIAGMQRQIEELRRRAEQGSQQLQGEVLELELEALLATRFPLDVFEPVAKGESGGDLLQRVIGPAGQQCGSILWETKRTKNWSGGWLPKLRTDQRAAKAEVALLVSEALPAGTENFDFVDGVYVASPRCALPIATMLRQSLISIANSRIAQDGQATKTEQVYAYLTGPRFRHRIEAIVEKFSDMQEDLAKEKRATVKLWAKREAQMQVVMDSTVGMYGDLQGIAGRAMVEIPALEEVEALLDGPKNEEAA